MTIPCPHPLMTLALAGKGWTPNAPQEFVKALKMNTTLTSVSILDDFSTANMAQAQRHRTLAAQKRGLMKNLGILGVSAAAKADFQQLSEIRPTLTITGNATGNHPKIQPEHWHLKAGKWWLHYDADLASVYNVAAR